MIEHIKQYLSLQSSIIEELNKRSVDLWCCSESDILGWACDSHGEHICCVENKTKAQLEIPLLTDKFIGIDAGHFIYFLKTTGVDPPSYSEMHEYLAGLENDGVLVQVQKNRIPVVWAIA